MTSSILGDRHAAMLRALCVLVGIGCASGTLAQHHEATAKPRPERPQLGTSAAFAANGSLLAVSRQGEHVVLQRSSDLGNTWSAPVAVNVTPEPILADGENRPKLLPLADGGVLVSWSRRLGKQYTGEVRIARSADGGQTFSPPETVHRDRQEIGHSFEALFSDREGRPHIVWLDKRDGEAAKAAKRSHLGSAIYAAVSDDGGRSFRPEVKVADHSCECCRIATAIDTDGAPLLLWRHVFEPNERDHAIAKLGKDGAPGTVERATFDRWKIDACPHHGPSLAVAADGTRHAVWFDQVDGEGHVYYGRLRSGRVEGQRTVGGERAAHADIAVAGRRVAIAWKEFDGERTQLRAEISEDGGKSFSPLGLAAAHGASDQPRLLVRGDALHVFWRTEHEGMRVFPLR